jgi:hypothetical protein
MTRSNKDRLPSGEPTQETAPTQDAVPAVDAASLQFIVPTEVVDLPSGGLYYPANHPLHNCGTIEIKHMTAKEEDILTSATLLKKGLAIYKMLQSIVVDKNIKIDDMLVGDKNSLLVHSRIFGYGPEYSTNIACPACSAKFEHTFDLNDIENKDIEENLSEFGIEITENNTFQIVLPKSQYEVEFKLLSSRDETKILNNRTARSLQYLETIVVSLNGQTDRFFVKRALSSMPILDVTILKRAHAKVTPDVDLTQDVSCAQCGEISRMEVPLDAGFFWPQL